MTLLESYQAIKKLYPDTLLYILADDGYYHACHGGSLMIPAFPKRDAKKMVTQFAERGNTVALASPVTNAPKNVTVTTVTTERRLVE